MRYSFLALTVLSLALIGQPVQGAPYRADSITPTPAAPGVSSVPLPFRAVARLGQGLINAVEISPDSKLIAVGGSVGVTVYEAATLKTLWSARGSVGIMKWSPDSALLAADLSGTSVWNAATGRLAYRLKDYSPTDLDWSPDGRRLVMASWNGLGLIWYLKAGTPPIPLSVRDCDPTGACIYEMHGALSPDGRLYATNYESGAGDVGGPTRVIIWDALTDVQKRVLPYSGGELKWLHDSNHLLMVSSGSVLRGYTETGQQIDVPFVTMTEWDARTGQQVDITSVTNGAFTPEGSFSLPWGELVAWEYVDADVPSLVDANTGAVLCNSGDVSQDFKLCAYQDGSEVAFKQLTNGTEVGRSKIYPRSLLSARIGISWSAGLRVHRTISMSGRCRMGR
ncbi:MAG: WD40 repeat domain-containing protein [Aggregatilineales bacterium]